MPGRRGHHPYAARHRWTANDRAQQKQGRAAIQDGQGHARDPVPLPQAPDGGGGEPLAGALCGQVQRARSSLRAAQQGRGLARESAQRRNSSDVPLATSCRARSNSTCASASAALLLSTAATRACRSATWLSTSCTARCRVQRWLLACASIARTAAVAACRSAFAVSTAACFSETATWYGSLSNAARSSPLCTRLLSSTRTRETCPATRGATNVTCPFTYASSVETVW